MKSKLYPHLKVGKRVTVDGVNGYVMAIHPWGYGQYLGPQHAYIWIRTPSLDFTEHVFTRNLQSLGFKTTQNGRAVSFEEIDKRMTLREGSI